MKSHDYLQQVDISSYSKQSASYAVCPLSRLAVFTMSNTDYPRLTESVNQSLLEGIVSTDPSILPSLICFRQRVDLDDFWMDHLRRRTYRQHLKWRESTMKSMSGCRCGQRQ
jgi:hypothetical protein